MYIGIDLGGTNIAGGLVTQTGEIIKQISLPTLRERGSDAVIEDIVKVIKALIASVEIGVAIQGIGIGIPGIANPHTGEVLTCVNLNWYNVPLRDALSAHFNVPIFIDNDATVAAVAEFLVAQKNAYQDAVMLTLGTGVGGGVLIGGKIISGHHGIGSELGHIIIGEALYTCNCGRNGCLETFASSTAIIHYAQHLIENGNTDTLLLTYSGGNPGQINGEMIFKAAKEGDAVAMAVVDRLVKYLSIGIINIVATIDPEVVVLGGGLSLAGDFLIEKVSAALEPLKYFKGSDVAKIEIAKLKNDAGIIGAALLTRLQA